ncbi:hypothetical protein, conserved [Trypanosoma brucei gambiense DAL972]|uniref:DEAD-box RNA helicase Q domain-containing protein n=1 Tax=Trypanosoma brucei gambiense (strain MHOM/CI/86/DAL972) TaxID=679716 RepID=C9ZV84_TRYB9|nr:hypothetical protein, conserved [Trypanosoma brucei gambiense DAL972]CBH13322.1 hypothetical protein, conserved [Trypanosoma brucei gambiense DAL972]|eukprot:XP_011775599.1 hypothetical protein, conserved [Trypanosoma brucei gambiense DAL972]
MPLSAGSGHRNVVYFRCCVNSPSDKVSSCSDIFFSPPPFPPFCCELLITPHSGCCVFPNFCVFFFVLLNVLSKRMETKRSFDSLGIHPTLVEALRRAGVRPTPFQARVLKNTTTDLADIIVDARAVSGESSSGLSAAEGATNAQPTVSERNNLMMIFVAHCVLSSRDSARHIGLVLANNKENAGRLQKCVANLAARCGITVETMTNEGQKPQLPSAEGDERECSSNGGKQTDGEGEYRIIIATMRALHSWDKALFAPVVTFAVEDASRSFDPPLDDVLRLLTQPDKTGQGQSNRTGSPLPSPGAPAFVPNIFLMCLASPVSLKQSIRYRLNRKNRRYYHIQTPSESHPPSPSPSAGVGDATQDPASEQLHVPPSTTPPASTQVLYLLYIDENDRMELLQRVLKMYAGRRTLLLTHHKEIRQLHQKVIKWDMYNTTGEAGGNGGGSIKATEYVHCMQRTDTPERQESTVMAFIRESTSGNRGGAGNKKSVPPTLLIGWDTFTAIDLVDVDVVIQYYPPQKSITRQECVGFVQVLHTTTDPKVGGRCHRTTLITFLSTSDFTLAAFFMEQYGLRGHILNVTPSHHHFERCLRNSAGVLEYKLRKQCESLHDEGSESNGTAQCSIPFSRPRSRRRGNGNRNAGSNNGVGTNASTQANMNAAPSTSNSDTETRRPLGRHRG